MPTFDSAYSDEQNSALVAAYARPGVTAKQVVAMAAAGELEHRGVRLDAFETNENTVRDKARKAARRGEQPELGAAASSPLVDAPHRDAIERLRRQLIGCADRMISAEEAKLPGAIDPERLRKAARLVREAASIPAPDEPMPPAPGQMRDGVRVGGATRGGPAGVLLQAHRASIDGGIHLSPEDPADVEPPEDLAMAEPDPVSEPTPADDVLELARRHGIDLHAA
jgi:hypothetical protein